MIDDPINAQFDGTVTLTMKLDDALVMRDFLASLCTDDFKNNLVYRESIPLRAQQVSGKFYRALRLGTNHAPEVPDAS